MRRALLTVALLPACADAPEDAETSSTGAATTGAPSPTTGAVDPTDPGELDAAEVVEAALPPALACAEVSAASVTLRNTGTTTWTRAGGYKLGAVDDADPLHPGEPRVWLADDVAVPPGGEHTFALELTAPAAGAYVTDWQMVREGVRWFGEVAAQSVAVSCDDGLPPGVVRLQGRALVDDDGPLLGLGATMMWAAWAYKFDRPKLEANLQFLSTHGFNYVRALGVVGDPNTPDYWDGREIDRAWPDYAEVIAGLTDLAHDTYGLRVEWTLIGDGQITVPTLADRQALIAGFLAMAAGRERKLMHFEVANEAWQNGFGGDAGLAELRLLSETMRLRSPNLVAASAPVGVTCAEAQAVYNGGVADLSTIHFDRDISQVEGSWRPVRLPWEHQFCPGLPVGSNNEPIGPGASVAEENAPIRLVAAAIETWIAGLPLYVFHSHAGVRGDDDIFTAPGADAFAQLRGLLPADLPDWDRHDATSPDAPFVVYAGEGGQLVADAMWVDLGAPESGAVRVHAAVRGAEFVALPIGILGSVTVAPRRALRVDVLEPISGAALASHTLAAGEMVTLSGADALLLRGSFE
jgi:hypothetical protein